MTRKLEKVILPESIKEIGDYAFLNMGELREINIPKGVERIGILAFALCYRIGLDISRDIQNVKSIGINAFSQSNIKGRVIFGENLEDIDGGAFYKTTITGVDLSRTKIKYLKTEVFSECRLLEKVKLPKRLIRIDSCTFEDCERLREIDIPESLVKNKGRSFSGL